MEGLLLDFENANISNFDEADLTHEAWERKSDAARAADVTTEIFQIPAVVGFFANTVAKNSEDDPPAAAVAVVVAAIRGLAMLTGSASEFAVAKTG